MHTRQDLADTLRRIDGRGYPAYKDLKGSWGFPGFTLTVDHVQGDPFATPSRVRVEVPAAVAALPGWTWSSPSREVALRDYLTRSFDAQVRGKGPRPDRGSGKSGLLAIDRPGQEMLERTSVMVGPSGVEARFVVGLPAFGRRIAGRQAAEVLLEELPRIVEAALQFDRLDSDRLRLHLETAEDADTLRDQLPDLDLVAFVADGAVLPRVSGVDDRPLQGAEVVPFESPPSLAVEVDLPNRGTVRGMGIRRGVTLVVGGGYHGKSTLLDAVERGIYNHVPGDGRELVVTDPAAVKVRAEDGRSVRDVDLRPFIDNLPLGRTTASFSTEDASGSTSQAAFILESLEVGASALLMDEDTSATNLMIRDHRMQELVASEQEPITPFIDKVGLLQRERGVSTVLVMGGSGDYFDVADTVICMVEYRARDVTGEARRIAERYRAERRSEGGGTFGPVASRAPLGESLDPSLGRRAVKVTPRGRHSLQFGRQDVDLGALEQLVDESQTRALGEALVHARRYMDGRTPVQAVLARVEEDLAGDGLAKLGHGDAGDLARFRPIELAGALNRLRGARFRQVSGARGT